MERSRYNISIESALHDLVSSLFLIYAVSDKVKRSVDYLLEFFQMEHGGSLRTCMVSIIFYHKPRVYCSVIGCCLSCLYKNCSRGLENSM